MSTLFFQANSGPNSGCLDKENHFRRKSPLKGNLTSAFPYFAVVLGILIYFHVYFSGSMIAAQRASAVSYTHVTQKKRDEKRTAALKGK